MKNLSIGFVLTTALLITACNEKETSQHQGEGSECHKKSECRSEYDYKEIGLMNNGTAYGAGISSGNQRVEKSEANPNSPYGQNSGSTNHMNSGGAYEKISNTGTWSSTGLQSTLISSNSLQIVVEGEDDDKRMGGLDSTTTQHPVRIKKH